MMMESRTSQYKQNDSKNGICNDRLVQLLETSSSALVLQLVWIEQGDNLKVTIQSKVQFKQYWDTCKGFIMTCRLNCGL